MRNHQNFGGLVGEVPSVSWNVPTRPATYPTVNTSRQPQALLMSPSTSTSESPSNTRHVRVYFNQDGHRLDPDVRYDKRLYASLKEKKLCNAFFLSKCEYANCGYDHSGELSHEELNTLRYIAKLKPCQSVYCEDACCVSGHVCPHDGKCMFGKGCRFPFEMHDVDKNVDNARVRWIAI